MKHISVTMIRPHLRELPDFVLPPGFRMRRFAEGDEAVWAEVAAASGLFTTRREAEARFAKEFGNATEQLKDRCFFVVDERGEAVGTAMAWYNASFCGECYGRIHWVGVRAEFQGRKLAKPLLSSALKRLAAEYEKAYLTSQTGSYKAIRMYLDFGFVPWMETPNSKEAWELLRSLTGHPALERLSL